MIVLAGILGGAIWGAMRARARKGSKLDIAQYATVHGILFGLIGLFVTIGLEWLL